MSTSIGPNTKVTLNFAIKLEDGQLVDSNFDSQPATFTVGDGSLLEGFEQALFGLQVGSHETLQIEPEQGFGMHNPSNIQRLPRTQFEDMALEEGLVISFQDPTGGELPGVVSRIDEQHVAVDFNHPLAGKSLQFEVKIVSVEAA
ncbi:FKBP-type peptidyl-prolyl cis-trans isomerase [Marinobacterium arenosum]|uniref:FKBP-type peptidyl-prolyl cis-trans isomerase n=1 Tax=Marinobacterium arenosum TaxID=2862496 RepID=UPI001C947263|nr:peptidylprolyl isomerase [Marinobacterium arenosum]MBY4678232.1 peptidylprolyl isomerase [Marinobacterium arenosum]